MSQIIDLTYFPKSKLVNILLDNLEKITLDGELVLEKGIKRNGTINEAYLLDLTKLSIIKRLRQQAFNYLTIRQRTVWEMKQYLAKHFKKSISIFKYNTTKIDQPLITSEIINDLIARKYLDDYLFAKTYIEQQMCGKGKGIRALSCALNSKGIDKKIVTTLIQDKTIISNEKINTLIDKSIAKVALIIRSRVLDKRKAKEILTRRLLSRGYEFEQIRTKIDEWLASEYNDQVN